MNSTLLEQTCQIPTDSLKNLVFQFTSINLWAILALIGVVLFIFLLFGMINENLSEPSYWVAMFLILFGIIIGLIMMLIIMTW